MPDGRLKLILKDESTGEFVDVVAEPSPRGSAPSSPARRPGSAARRPRRSRPRVPGSRGSTCTRARREVSLVGDTARVEDVERAPTPTRSGGVDIWVNNAARLFVRPVVETTDEDWHGLLGANLHGYFYGCRAAARRMLAQGTGGRIVNVTSAVNVLAVADLSAYGAAKGAIAVADEGARARAGAGRDHGQRGRAGRDRHGAERGRVHAGGAAHVRAADPARPHRRRPRRSPT